MHAETQQAEVLRNEWSRLEQALLQLVGANRFEERTKASAPEAGDLLSIETRQLELDRSLDALVRLSAPDEYWPIRIPGAARMRIEAGVST